ncbi:MAG: hypothetical protein V7641_4552 [Blastocatellia bacterium]
MSSQICPACGKAIKGNQKYKVCPYDRMNFHLNHSCPQHPSTSMLIVDPMKPKAPNRVNSLPTPRRLSNNRPAGTRNSWRSNPSTHSSNPKFEDCFIASAVYGQSNASQLSTLRKFRDELLLKKLPGRLFIAAYYKVSPSFARRISRSENSKRIIKKLFLEPTVWIIEKLMG